jgi:hypothetical protein
MHAEVLLRTYLVTVEQFTDVEAYASFRPGTSRVPTSSKILAAVEAIC